MCRSRVWFAVFSVLLIRGVFAELPWTLGTLVSDLDDLVGQDTTSRVEFLFFKASNIRFGTVIKKIGCSETFQLISKTLA